MTLPKKQDILDMTVNEVSSVDQPAQKGAVAVLTKRAYADTPIRKNAADIAAGTAQPLFKAAAYGDAIMDRASELGTQHGCTAAMALYNHAESDPVIKELAWAERAAEAVIMKRRSETLFAGRDA